MIITLIIVFFAVFGPMMNEYKFSDQNIRHAKAASENRSAFRNQLASV